jgi:hypothetical protein
MWHAWGRRSYEWDPTALIRPYKLTAPLRRHLIFLVLTPHDELERIIRAVAVAAPRLFPRRASNAWRA